MFGAGAGWVVALLANLPAGAVPDLVQILQCRLEYGFGIAPDLHVADAESVKVQTEPGSLVTPELTTVIVTLFDVLPLKLASPL